MRQRRLDDPERRVDVRLHRRVEVFGADVEDRAARLLPSGIADHDVEPAELANRLVHQAPAEPLVAQVARDRDRLAAGLADQIDHLAGVRLLGGQVVDGDVGPFAGIGDGRRPTHA